ncbi:MAG TPA: YXWGXW repeat-containing protein [Opitutaceae bacterium]|nr:YXWGXW repeat-containing protein [Opitutaceae bacterium]
MLKQTLFVSGIVAAAFLSGCEGTGPSTQQGAVTGGALGALAGAIIGHNSGGGNTLGGALIGGAAGALAGGTIGNSVDHQNGTVYSDESGERRAYRVVEAPPPPPPAPAAETVTPSPASNAVWIPGYWSFDGTSYSWVAGHWEIPPPNAHSYVAAHWENQGGGYFFVPAYWR